MSANGREDSRYAPRPSTNPGAACRLGPEVAAVQEKDVSRVAQDAELGQSIQVSYVIEIALCLEGYTDSVSVPRIWEFRRNQYNSPGLFSTIYFPALYTALNNVILIKGVAIITSWPILRKTCSLILEKIRVFPDTEECNANHFLSLITFVPLIMRASGVL